eukprot:PhF_6_TR19604/c0_g1_i3/m.28603
MSTGPISKHNLPTKAALKRRKLNEASTDSTIPGIKIIDDDSDDDDDETVTPVEVQKKNTTTIADIDDDSDEDDEDDLEAQLEAIRTQKLQQRANNRTHPDPVEQHEQQQDSNITPGSGNSMWMRDAAHYGEASRKTSTTTSNTTSDGGVNPTTTSKNSNTAPVFSMALNDAIHNEKH